MYAANLFAAAWLSCVFWWQPEPNYWEYWMQETLRKPMIPNIPG